MGSEQSKPGPMVQALLDLGGVDITGAQPPDLTHTPRLPGKQTTIVADGSDGHALGNVIVAKPPKVLAKNSQPL